jgi:hypothetical protein
MLRLILSNLVLAYVAFLLGWFMPREEPQVILLRYPPPTCSQELERLREENHRLYRLARELRSELADKEDVSFILRETVRNLLDPSRMAVD